MRACPVGLNVKTKQDNNTASLGHQIMDNNFCIVGVHISWGAHDVPERGLLTLFSSIFFLAL